MNHAMPILLLSLVSCVSHPNITEYNPETGNYVRYSTGVTLMARQKQVVAEVKGPNGRSIKLMIGEVSSEDVPKAITGAVAGVKIAGHTSAAAMNASDNATAEVLGAQGVQKHQATLEAAGKATSEALPLSEPANVIVQPIKAPGS